jgi:predicted nucleic acid-binding protein
MNAAIIGIDSQCTSYLIDAMQGVEKPSDNFALEKIALFRTYLYTTGTLYVTPTVTEECSAIRNIARKELHESYLMVLFGESQIQDSDNIELRVNELSHYHNGNNDCRILAEAEEAEFTALLTYDNDFLSRLQGVSSLVKLYRPTEYWSQLNIAQGSKPDKIPHKSNPMAQQEWWKW